MQQQEDRLAAEQCFQLQGYVFKQQEESLKTREHILHEWEKLQLNIREQSKALGHKANFD